MRSARVPIAAKLVADLLTAAGVHRVLTMDLHAEQIQGFLQHPRSTTSTRCRSCWPTCGSRISTNLMVVSPDVGGVVRARRSPSAWSAIWRSSTSVPGRPTSRGHEHHRRRRGRTCVLMDDIVDTAGTLCKARLRAEGDTAPRIRRRLLRAPGALRRGVSRINDSSLDELVVTDTIRCRRAQKSRASVSCRSPTCWPNDPPHQQRGFGFVAVHRIVFPSPLPGRGRGSQVPISLGAVMKFELNATQARTGGSGRAAACVAPTRSPGIIYGGAAGTGPDRIRPQRTVLALRKEAFHPRR